jgi:YD repeat-containing protein
MSRAYDDDCRVVTSQVSGSPAVTYQFDAGGLVIGAGDLALTRHAQTGFLTGTALGTIADTRGFNTVGELTSYAATASGQPRLSITYQRDLGGRIALKTEIERLASGSDVTTESAYTYDVAGRLESVTTNGGLTATYTYDANGNRLTRTTGSGSDTATFDDQDRMTTYDGTTFTYTANGELATKASKPST